MERLPENVQGVLESFVQTAQAAFGSDLLSVVLYGSGAEGKLRATSDVNVILLLAKFEPAAVDRIRGPLSLASTAIRLRAMFLLQDEIVAASEAFAQKFVDILRRRRILYGPDPFVAVEIPRTAAIHRLKQVLLNLTLRLRESYASGAANEQQVASIIAETSGPIRTCAASLLEMEGSPYRPPKESLGVMLASLAPPLSPDLAAWISEAREKRPLPPGAAPAALLDLIDLCGRMQLRANRLT
jgi:predicted nucleotidyltransferase